MAKINGTHQKQHPHPVHSHNALGRCFAVQLFPILKVSVHTSVPPSPSQIQFHPLSKSQNLSHHWPSAPPKAVRVQVLTPVPFPSASFSWKSSYLSHQWQSDWHSPAAHRCPSNQACPGKGPPWGACRCCQPGRGTDPTDRDSIKLLSTCLSHYHVAHTLDLGSGAAPGVQEGVLSITVFCLKCAEIAEFWHK